MKALVTGAGGFAGRHLVDLLAVEGDDVVATDRANGGPDLCDAEAVRGFVADEAPQAIYHLGGWADVGGSWQHPLEAFRVNAEGTLNVLEAARSARVGRVLCISSADVYGQVTPEQLPITEDHPLAPVTPYAASKVAADYLALQAWLGHGLEVIRARSFNHIGPGQAEQFVTAALAMRIARNEIEGGDEVKVGNLTPQRDLTDVRDVVRAYRMLMIDGEPGVAYNVCSGRALAIEQICNMLLSLANRPMAVVPDPDLQRPVDTPVLLGDNSRLRAATGWAPAIDITTTLSDLMDDCRARVKAQIAAPPTVP